MAVNLSPVGGVAAQFFTNSGAVLTGGKLYTYAAGTTTPAATYTNSSGSTAQPNPIVLDAAGRVPNSGEIWLTDGVNYKFVLKDANDVLIATYDNVSGINSNFIAFTNNQEIFTATSGQTVFTLANAYQPGTNSLSVFVDGVNQYGSGAQYAYVETNSTTVTFNAGLHVGAEVKFTTTQQQGAGAVDASQVTYDPPFTGSVVTNVEAKLAQTVSVKDFGAVGDGVTDDTAAIQAALDELQTYSAASSGATAYGNSQTLYFPFGQYLISQTLTYTKEYLTIESNGAAFLPAGGFDQNTFVFDLTLWQAEVNDLVFSGFDKCIYAHNPNTDQGKVEFNNITIHGGETGFKIDMRSTHTELNNCKWDRTVHPIEIVEGDRVDVNGGWCKQGVMTVAYDGSFLNSSTFAVLTLNDVLMVPILSTGSKTAWVKNYGQFRAYNTRFGGENGARAWVNNFAQADTTAPIDPRGIIFDGCELYGTIEGVRCFYLPNTIIIRDCIGFADTDAFIHFDPAFETLDNELARVGSNFSYVLDNPQRFKTLPVNDAKLLPYLYTGDGTSFGQTNTSTAAPATLLFQNGRDIQQILDTAEYSTFEVQLYTVRDTNVDTYSEFTVKGGGNISPGIERVLVTSLHTGADATAPVLFLDVDNLVKIQLNGDTNTRLVFYRITKVGRFFG